MEKILEGKYDIDIIYLSKFPQGGFTSNFSAVNRKFISMKNNHNPNIDTQKIELDNLYYYSNDKGHFPLQKIFSQEKYDAILFFYSKALSDKRLLATFFDLDKTIVCINNEKWTDIGPEKFYNNFLQGVGVIACCNSKILEEFSNYSNNCLRLSQCVPDSFLVTEEEAEKRFRNRFAKRKIRPVVGFSGNTKNVLKNFENIKAACKMSGATLLVAKIFLGRTSKLV